jgi:hypothetical protein
MITTKDDFRHVEEIGLYLSEVTKPEKLTLVSKYEVG